MYQNRWRSAGAIARATRFGGFGNTVAAAAAAAAHAAGGAETERGETRDLDDVVAAEQDALRGPSGDPLHPLSTRRGTYFGSFGTHGKGTKHLRHAGVHSRAALGEGDEGDEVDVSASRLPLLHFMRQSFSQPSTRFLSRYMLCFVHISHFPTLLLVLSG